jgi:hypothetical protein
MEWWQVYLFTRLDGINIFFMITAVAGVILSIIAIVVYYSTLDSEYSKDEHLFVDKYLKPIIAITAISIGVSIALPTQKDMAAIILLPKVVNNQDIQKMPADAAKLLRVKLEQWIDAQIALPTKEEKK